MPKPKSRQDRFSITRRIVRGKGISAEVELDATDAKDAERQVADLFSHETGVTASYAVRRLVAARSGA